MSRIGIQGLTLATVGGIALSALVTGSPANSTENTVVGTAAPRTVAAVAPMFYPSRLRVTLPAGGTATTTSPTIPANAKSMTVTVSTELSKDDRLLLDLYTNLATLSNRKRLLTCAAIGLIGMGMAEEAADKDSQAGAMGVLKQANTAMNMCFQVVRYLATPRSALGSKEFAQASPCPQAAVNIPIAATGSGATSTLTATGPPSLATMPALRITCKVDERGMVMTFRPRSKKMTLRKVVGAALSIGFASPSGSTTSVPLELNYAKPR